MINGYPSKTATAAQYAHHASSSNNAPGKRKENATYKIRAMSRSKFRLLFPGPNRELRDSTDLDSAARDAASARLSPFHHDWYMGVVTARKRSS